MSSTNLIDIYARDIGHGATRAAIAFGKLFYGNSWPGYVFYDHQLSGVNADAFYRRAHSILSNYEIATALYNNPFVFNLIRGMPDGFGLEKWATHVSISNNPVVLCHESLAHALIRKGSKQPKFLYALNVALKPGEKNISGLDGIIVRSQESKEILLEQGYRDEQIHVGTLVDPDIANNRGNDSLRRAARSRLCQYMQDPKDLGWLRGDFVPPYVPSGIRNIKEEYLGRFTVALLTSGSGHKHDQIRELIHSFRQPLASGLVNLVLIGNYVHPKSPMTVADQEARMFGINPHINDKFSPQVEGLQIIHSGNTKGLVDQSIQLIRRADVVLLTSATDILATTEAAAVPAYIGDYRGLHEKVDRNYALREEGGHLAYDWSWRTEGGWAQTWTRIFENARNNQSDLPTLFAVANNLRALSGTNPHDSNQSIKSFIERRCIELGF